MRTQKHKRFARLPAILAAALTLTISGSGYTETYNYYYDDIGRLVLMESGSGATLRSRAYNYDAAGNRTSVVAGYGNSPPIANPDWVPFSRATGFVMIYPLDNDTDPDNDSLSIHNFTQPTYGYINQISPTQLMYQCNSSMPGCSTASFVSFNYTVTDGKGATDTGFITVSFSN